MFWKAWFAKQLWVKKEKLTQIWSNFLGKTLVNISENKSTLMASSKRMFFSFTLRYTAIDACGKTFGTPPHDALRWNWFSSMPGAWGGRVGGTPLQKKFFLTFELSYPPLSFRYFWPTFQPHFLTNQILFYKCASLKLQSQHKKWKVKVLPDDVLGDWVQSWAGQLGGNHIEVKKSFKYFIEV